MRTVCVALLLTLLAAPGLFADTQDTAVFRTRMVPQNENPPIIATDNSLGTITIRVTRDGRGNVNAAAVVFDIDYTVASAQTFTGLHIHNAVSGVNGPVVINTGISGTSPVVVDGGSGRISRTVNYAATDTAGLRWVTGVLATPENYYVNIHTTTNPGGYMRGQLMAYKASFRPIMSPLSENPALPALDAIGAALVEVEVNRDPATGNITSGTVTFDVDFRFPGNTTFTGLHLHNGASGVNGPVVIDSGINGTTRSVTLPSGTGNIFRIAEIDSTNTTGLAALTGIMADPAQYYINLHTTVNTGGAIRGQLNRNGFVFYNLMTGGEEVPAVSATGNAESLTYVRVDRDATGNVVSGAVGFNVWYSLGSGAFQFTGMHIHNGRQGANGGVVIDSGISAANSVSDNDGIGYIGRVVDITSANATALDSLRGLADNAEAYYVNLHTTTNTAGYVRSQLSRETYHFKTNMSTANEVPPVVSSASGTGWVTARISRDTAGAINGATVIFDINHVNNEAMTITGLHIHHPGSAGINAGVTINTGIAAGASAVESATGTGNVYRTVNVDSTSATGLATLNTLVSNPEGAYVNLHTAASPGGLIRSQLLAVVNTVAQTAGGGDWMTSITVRNPSATVSVQGTVNSFQGNGSAMPESLADPVSAFLIPPSGSTTFNVHNKGTLTSGFARVFSSGPVNVEARYSHPVYTSGTAGSTTVTSRSVSIPVAVGATPSQNTGVAMVPGATGDLTLSLRDSAGVAIAGGSRTLSVTANQQVVGFVKDLLPSVTLNQFTGTLTATASAGQISTIALRFNGAIAPVTVTPLP